MGLNNGKDVSKEGVTKMSNKLLQFVLLLILLPFYILFLSSNCNAQNSEYKISSRPDGGYSLDIVVHKRHWKPITAEGIFPKETKNYSMDIIGKGKDWSFRNQEGYYYAIEQIESKNKAWDIGFAWVDNKLEYLYLNLYWVSAPNEITPSDVNGKYSLTGMKGD